MTDAHALAWIVIYIGATDLVPEVRERSAPGGAATNLAMFVVGAGLMYFATRVG